MFNELFMCVSYNIVSIIIMLYFSSYYTCRKNLFPALKHRFVEQQAFKRSFSRYRILMAYGRRV